MNPFWTTFGLIVGPFALAWIVWLCLGQTCQFATAADIERIEEGLPEPTPTPVEPEPFRRIAWDVDEEFDAMVRAVRWPTDELARIKELVAAGVS